MKAIILVIFAPFLLFADIEYSKETYMVPMRDGVRLATDIYRPSLNGPKPVILYRTPYNKESSQLDGDIEQIIMSLGIIYVVQDTRGRFASEGIDSVYVTDGWGALQDGYDTMDWLINQEWCNGKIAMMGASATGITTYRAAGSLHPNLVAGIAIVAASDFYHQVVFPGGAFRKRLCEGWVSEQGSDYMIPFFKSMPYYNSFWENMNLHTRTSQMTTPILHITGWYDCFLEGSFAAYSDLVTRENAGTQKLIIGPWTHDVSNFNQKFGGIAFPNSSYELITMLLMWMGNYLVIPNGVEDMPNVSYYLMGDPAATEEPGCEWVTADTWPPPSDHKHLNLSPSGQITHYMVAPDSLTFVYNPDEPFPTFGGNNLFKPYGWQAADSVLSSRSDVLAFSTNAVTEPVRIEGTVQANLLVSSDAVDTDFTLMLLNVYPDGREILITDGIACTRYRNGDGVEDVELMVPGEKYNIEIKTPPIAIVFNTGHKIKVLISSSNYPRFEVNPNTGAEPTNVENKIIAKNTLHLGGSNGRNGSTLTLPVVSGKVRVQSNEVSPTVFHVEQNYPNPFNPCTTIAYDLDRDGLVRVDIYNNLGRHISSLLDEHQAAGRHQVVWNGMQENGFAASGIYYCKVRFNQQYIIKKMLLVR